MAKYRVAGNGFWDGTTLYARGDIIEWDGPEGEALEALEGKRKPDVRVSRASLVENWRPKVDEEGNKVGKQPEPDRMNPNASVPGDPDPDATVESTGQFDSKAASDARKKAQEEAAREAKAQADRVAETDHVLQAERGHGVPKIEDADKNRAPPELTPAERARPKSETGWPMPDDGVGGTDRNRAHLVDEARRAAEEEEADVEPFRLTKRKDAPQLGDAAPEDDDEPTKRGPGRPRKA